MSDTEQEQYETVERLKQLAKTIRNSTRPIKGHTDPESINDCWNELDYLADSLFSKSEVKRIAFRTAELAVIEHMKNRNGIAPLEVNYEQVIANKGLVINKPKDH